MKRTDFKLTLNDFIAELKLEVRFRRTVYQKKIDEGKMQKYTANKRILIVILLQELLELAETKQLSYNELKDILETIPTNRPTFRQGKMQFPN